MSKKSINRISALLIISLFINGVFVFKEVRSYMDDQTVDIIDEIPPEAGALDRVSYNTIMNIKKLEEEIKTELKLSSTKDVNNATMALLRRKKYGHYTSGASVFLWLQYAGGIESETGVSMSKAEETLKDVLKVTEDDLVFTDPVTKSKVDLIHMIAVIDINYTDVQIEDYKEVYYDYLLSWGGDLETLRINMSKHFEKNDAENYDDYYAYAIKTLGSNIRSYFSKEDMLADVDGVNLFELMSNKDILLSEAMENYYTGSGVLNRNQLFVDHFGGQEAFEREVTSFMFNGRGSRFQNDNDFLSFMESFEDLKGMMYNAYSDGPVIENEHATTALSTAFIDKIGQNNY